MKQLVKLAEDLARPKTEKLVSKGGKARAARCMILGIPNVGKSSLINRLAGSAKAKAADKPGVTRAKQWIKLGSNLDLLDMPGILWPKFEDPEVGLRLAWTGAVKDDILDTETLAARLMDRLWTDYPEALRARYKLESFEPGPDFAALTPAARGFALMEQAARKRGFLLPGAELDLERMSAVLLEEYRACKLGRFTLEQPSP
jgi:ribosome biogenesis GTPase A